MEHDSAFYSQALLWYSCTVVYSGTNPTVAQRCTFHAVARTQERALRDTERTECSQAQCEIRHGLEIGGNRRGMETPRHNKRLKSLRYLQSVLWSAQLEPTTTDCDSTTERQYRTMLYKSV